MFTFFNQAHLVNVSALNRFRSLSSKFRGDLLDFFQMIQLQTNCSSIAYQLSLCAVLKTSQIQYNLNILSIASSLFHHSNITFNFVFSIQYCLDCFEWQLEWREALHKYRSVAQINATHGFIVVFCQFLNFFSFMKMVK